jgi:hypothetical protein
MKRILFLFLDGVGLDVTAPSNPLSTHDGDAFRHFAGGQHWIPPFDRQIGTTHLLRPLDATLGVEGLPQSGTGQASLLTGVNCAKQVGRHFGPYPHSKTHATLDAANLFHKVQALFPQHPAPAAFANAFPPQYFDAPRRRDAVTTRCCQAAGMDLRDIAALQTGKAIPADLTGRTWRDRLDLNVPLRTPEETANVLVTTARDHALTFFEYFLTDKVGHRRIDVPPSILLSDLDAFLNGLLNTLRPSQETVLITSDHGNLEDTNHTQHTCNPVPLIVYGWAAPHFADANDLTDVTPGIVRALRSANAPVASE